MLRTGPCDVANVGGCDFAPPDTAAPSVADTTAVTAGFHLGFFPCFMFTFLVRDLGCSEPLLPSQMGVHPSLLTCSRPYEQQQAPGPASLAASIHLAQSSFPSSALTIPPGDCRQKPNCMT